MTMALQRENPEQIGRRVAHVGALAAGRALRDPEQTKQAHHVVDAQRAGVAKGAAQHLNEVSIPVLPERPRIHRRQAPVLAEVRIRIGRRADRDAVEKETPVHPGIGTRPRRADGEVLIEADLHSSGARFSGDLTELPIELELQPFVEVDALRMLCREPLHLHRCRILKLGGPHLPRPLVARLGDRHPGGIVVQRGSGAGDERIVRRHARVRRVSLPAAGETRRGARRARATSPPTPAHTERDRCVAARPAWRRSPANGCAPRAPVTRETPARARRRCRSGSATDATSGRTD